MLMWCVCISCHHATKRVVPKGKADKLVCTICGSHVARVVKVLRQSMLNGGQMPREMARRLTHAGLVSIAKERGYKPGWATAKYRTIFHDWPSRQIPEPSNPNAEILWWVRKGNIAYAKKNFPREKKKLVVEKPSELMNEADWNTDL
jgi:hypothetical protein